MNASFSVRWPLGSYGFVDRAVMFLKRIFGLVLRVTSYVVLSALFLSVVLCVLCACLFTTYTFVLKRGALCIECLLQQRVIVGPEGFVDARLHRVEELRLSSISFPICIERKIMND